MALAGLILDELQLLSGSLFWGSGRPMTKPCLLMLINQSLQLGGF